MQKHQIYDLYFKVNTTCLYNISQSLLQNKKLTINRLTQTKHLQTIDFLKKKD